MTEIGESVQHKTKEYKYLLIINYKIRQTLVEESFQHKKWHLETFDFATASEGKFYLFL